MKGGHPVALEDLELFSHRDAAPFWLVVDSQNSYQAWTQSDGWEEAREGCLALRSDGDRCGQDPRDGDPFCAFHFERAAGWFLARASEDQIRREQGRIGMMFKDAAQTLAAANAVLSASPEGHRVYFYELAGQGLVKIGTSRRPEQRVKVFRTGKGCTFPPDCDPSTGHLIGHVAGDVAVEQAMHRRHHRHRVVGEWFRLTDALADEIQQLLEADAARAA